ncbi:MAG: hypothetical protein U0804_10790 [Gemmataceae bacterium]
MPVWLVKLLHAIGLTNLSQRDIERYAARRSPPELTFTSAPILRRTAGPLVSFVGTATVTSGMGR